VSKPFSELEKKIINSLLSLDERDGLNVLGNIITEYLPSDYYIQINSESDAKIMLLSEAESRIDLSLLDSNLYKLLLTIFSLFEHLKSERYIHFAGKYDASNLGIVCADEQYIACEFIDEDLQKPLHEYATHKFFITETFRQFVADGYKTKNEIKGSEELWYTRVALGVTFVGLIASIFIPLLSTTEINLKNEVLQISSKKATNQYIDRKVLENKVLIENLTEKVDLLSTDITQTIDSINE